MADVSLGKVTTTAGVPKRLTANLPDPTKTVLCHSYMVEVLPGNTGKVYILDSPAGSGAAMTRVVSWLAVPTVNSSPSWTVALSSSANSLNVADRYLDVEKDGEGVIVTIAIQ